MVRTSEMQEAVQALLDAIPEHATPDEIADKFEIAAYGNRELLCTEAVSLVMTLLSRRLRPPELELTELLDDVDEALIMTEELVQMTRYRIRDLRGVSDVRDLPRVARRAGGENLMSLVPNILASLELPIARLVDFENFVIRELRE